MSKGSEWLTAGDTPDPLSLTDTDHASIANVTSLVGFVLRAALDGVGDSSNMASVYEPFQVLLRQIMVAAAQYGTDNDYGGITRIASELLTSGKLDSPSVARAPTPAEVGTLVFNSMFTSLQEMDSPPEAEAKVQSIVADAMDCAYKQAIAAPQTVGSRFTRPEAG